MPEDKRQIERRSKTRFPIHRELRYKLLEDDVVIESGMGETIDMASGGMAFQIERPLKVGAFVELSISWPVLLDDSCAMRLIDSSTNAPTFKGRSIWNAMPPLAMSMVSPIPDSITTSSSRSL